MKEPAHVESQPAAYWAPDYVVVGAYSGGQVSWDSAHACAYFVCVKACMYVCMYVYVYILRLSLMSGCLVVAAYSERLVSWDYAHMSIRICVYICMLIFPGACLFVCVCVHVRDRVCACMGGACFDVLRAMLSCY